MNWRNWLVYAALASVVLADCGDASGDKSINGQPCSTVSEQKWTNTRHYICEDDGHGNKRWVEQA